MDLLEAKQAAHTQYTAIFLVILGLTTMFLGCHFHYAELTTAAAGAAGAGLGLLKAGSTGNNLRAGGAISVISPDPVVE